MTSYDEWRTRAPENDDYRECANCGTFCWGQDDAERVLCGQCEEYEATFRQVEGELP